jgi:hypothetical protein
MVPLNGQDSGLRSPPCGLSLPTPNFSARHFTSPYFQLFTLIAPAINLVHAPAKDVDIMCGRVALWHWSIISDQQIETRAPLAAGSFSLAIRPISSDIRRFKP